MIIIHTSTFSHIHVIPMASMHSLLRRPVLPGTVGITLVEISTAVIASVVVIVTRAT